ncbi:MAG: hypothetical protein ACLSX2_11605, partial [Christensenellaceae bacterium]
MAFSLNLSFRWLQNFFTPSKMIKPQQVVAELPSSGEIYRTAYQMAWPSTLEAFLVGLVSMVDT